MPPAPLPCPCPCSPPPPQGRWPVCAERGTCAPSLLHFFTSPLPPSFFFPFSFAPPPIRVPVLPRSPPRGTPLRSSAPPLLHLHFPAPLLMRSSPPPFFFFLLSFVPPPIRVPVFPRSPPCDTPLIRSSISTSPLLCSFVPPRLLFSSSSFPSSLRPFGTPFSRVPRRATLHSAPPSPLPRSSAHSFLPAPFFSSSTFPSSLRPFGTPFPRVPRRATLPSPGPGGNQTGNRERGRQPCRRSRRTKKSGPHGPDSIGYQSVFQKKKGRLHLAHTNALTQHNQSGAYPLINPCSHN